MRTRTQRGMLACCLLWLGLLGAMGLGLVGRAGAQGIAAGSIIKSEGWESAPPSTTLPTGWVKSGVNPSNMQTLANFDPHTGSNSLYFAAGGLCEAAWGTPDTNGGNVRTGTWTYITSVNSTTNVYYAYARQTSTDYTTSNKYAVTLQSNSTRGVLGISYLSGQSESLLSYVLFPAPPSANDQYYIEINCLGSALSARCQRQDGKWLNSAGAWVTDAAGNTYACTVTDTQLTGAGYSGIGYFTTTYATDMTTDDFVFQNISGSVRSASTYYVNTSGSDAADGLSPATAWQTLTKASSGPAGGYVPGDTIKLTSGQTFSGSLSLTTSGTSALPITVATTSAAPATIQPPGNADTGVLLTDVSFVTVRNLNVVGTGVTASAATSQGVGIEVQNTQTATGPTYTQGVWIDRCTVSGEYGGIYAVNANGVFPAAASPGTTGVIVGQQNLLITGCTVHDGGLAGIYLMPSTPAPNGSEGVYQSALIDHCTVYNMWGDATRTGQSGDGILICGGTNCREQYSLIYNCGLNSGTSGGGPGATYLAWCDHCTIQYCEAYGTSGVHANVYDFGGFDLDAGCSACIVQYCYSHDNAGWGFYAYGFGSYITDGNIIRYCISQNDGQMNSAGLATDGTATGTHFYNNTVYQAAHPVLSLKNSGDALNNIFYMTGASVLSASSATTPTYSHNVYYSTAGTPFLWNGVSYSAAAWQALGAGFEAGGSPRVTDPLFTSIPPTGASALGGKPTTGLQGFRLPVTSPCIDNGADIVSDVGLTDFLGNATRQGTGFDIGAIEYPSGGYTSLYSRGSRPAPKGGH